MEIILRHLRQAHLGEVVAPYPIDFSILTRVHEERYVHFLESAYRLWLEAQGQGDAFPYVWPPHGTPDKEPEHIFGKLGYFSFDSGTPLGPYTFNAAVDSASVAVTASRYILQGASLSFALCRPPGHHAGTRFYGGYCFFNNAALAAQNLRDSGLGKIAILDVDYHHGNGTQQIFYKRSDVLYVSIHADAATHYPYFLGHADETGNGYNLNIPLPAKTAWSVYQQALASALERITAYKADAVIVSFGADTFEGDPISEFLLKHEDYIRMGEQIGALKLPTLVVMEGGYAIDALGINTANFLSGLLTQSR